MSRWTCVGYGVGALGTSVFATVTSLKLLFFLTNVVGVPAAWAGLAVFVPKAWDVVTDPAMGAISDRTRSRWGRRRPYLLAGAVVLGGLVDAATGGWTVEGVNGPTRAMAYWFRTRRVDGGASSPV